MSARIVLGHGPWPLGLGCVVCGSEELRRAAGQNVRYLPITVR